MPPTGRPGSIPANWVTAIPASRRSSSRSIDIERAEQHLGQLFAAEVAAGAAALHVAGHAAEQLLGQVELVLQVGARAEQREVDVEHGVERGAVALVLHQRRAEHRAQDLALADVDVLDRPHGVEVLGHRHRQPRRPQLVDEPLEHVQHRGRMSYAAASGTVVTA